jgi:hypothetical protein
MGEYETDSGPMDALRTRLKAARTEAARIDPKPLGAAIRDVREQLAHRPMSLPEPLPERTAVLQSQVAARFEELPRKPQSAADRDCSGYVTLADAFYDLAHDATDFEDAHLW